MRFWQGINFTTGFKRILSNTGYLFGEKVFNMALSLVVGIWVARYLGPDDFGLLQYANSLVGLVTAVATLGTTNIVIRDLVDQPAEDEGRILGTSFILMLGAGFSAGIIIVAVGFWLNNEIVTRWLIVIISVNLVLQAFQVFDYWFQSKVMSKFSVYARTTANIFVAVLKVLFILLSLSVVYFAVTVIVAGITRVIVWLISYKKQESNILSWEFDAEYAIGLLKDCWPLILSGLSVSVYMKIDQVMLKNMLNASAVGNYSVAASISELWYFIPTTIASSVFPSIIKSKKADVEKYHRRLQYLYDVLAGMSIVIALPMTIFSGFIIELLFGIKYALAGSVLAVHIWAGLFVFLGVARSKWIINENYQFYGMIFTIVGAITNVVLNLWWIPIIGIMGAAWATVVSQALSAWIMAAFFKETRLAFIMHTRSILNALFVYPILKSVDAILKEAKGK